MKPRGLLRQQKAHRPRSNPIRCKLKFIVLLPLLLPPLWLGYRELGSRLWSPKAVLVLGGAKEREDFAAEFAQQHTDLPVWISGGSNPEYTQAVFTDAGVDLQRVHIDRLAVDTVTNFTTLADKFQAQGIDNVYLITSDYHMRRARVIGEIVFGSRGIYLRPVSVPSQRDAEPLMKAIRDGGRSLLWLTTGHTGSSLSQHFEPDQ